MELTVKNTKGADTGEKVSLSEVIFGIEPNDHAIYQTYAKFWPMRVKAHTRQKSAAK